MTGRELLIRARELAYHLEKDAGRPGAATMLFELINEIERLRVALDDALAEIVELVEVDIGREARGTDLPAAWHRGRAALKATGP